MRFKKGQLAEAEIRKRIKKADMSFVMEGIIVTNQNRKDAYDLLSGKRSDEEIKNDILRRYGFGRSHV